MPSRNPKNTDKPTELPADDDAYVRLRTVLRVLPVGEETWRMGVADGRFPKPVKLTPRVNGWNVGAIRKLLRSFSE